MEIFNPHFPTPGLNRAEIRLRAHLNSELNRLRLSKHNDPLCAESLKRHLEAIIQFTTGYHARYMDYLEKALEQGGEPVLCKAGCSNCCHHFPLSVEPFESITLYASLRDRPDLLSLLEACHNRVRLFESIRRGEAEGDDGEDKALHEFYARWQACPFLEDNGWCGVHPKRPGSCRMYYSLTDPAFCIPEYLQTPLNRSFQVYLPDTLEESLAEIAEFYEALEIPDSLYGGILRLNELEWALS